MQIQKKKRNKKCLKRNQLFKGVNKEKMRLQLNIIRNKKILKNYNIN